MSNVVATPHAVVRTDGLDVHIASWVAHKAQGRIKSKKQSEV